MRYSGALAILVLLLASCVNQKEGPLQPDQPMDPTASYAPDEDRLVFPPKAATPDQGTDAAEASLIPGEPEATYDPAIGRIKVYTDFESFDEATGELTPVDFDDLPAVGSSCPGPQGYEDSIPNPLTIGGVTFADPICLESQYCTDPTCPSGGVVLFLDIMATIDFPLQTGGVMLAVEGMGDDSFTVRVEDWWGATVTASAQGIPFGTRYLGFTSPVGVARVEVLSVENGILILRGVFFEDH